MIPKEVKQKKHTKKAYHYPITENRWREKSYKQPEKWNCAQESRDDGAADVSGVTMRDGSLVGSQNSVQFTNRKETGILAEAEAAFDTIEHPFHNGCSPK